jgi:hypothetical protein
VEVNGQHDAPAALFPGRELSIHPRAGLDSFAIENVFVL